MDPVQYHFIVNPKAGKGKAPKMIPAITAYMMQRNLPFSIYTTKSPGDAEQYVRTVSQTGDAVRFYVCGGDGTLNEAVNGAAYVQNAAVGVIPFGSGNDFIRNFDHSALFEDLQSQIDGEPIKVDLLSANGRYALNMINIGFDCEVVMQVDRLRHIPLLKGSLAYLVSVFLVLTRKMGHFLRLRLPDNSAYFGSFLLCTIANGRFYGGGFCAAPDSCVNDGYFNLALVRKIGRLRFLSILPFYKKGSHTTKKRLQGLLFSRKLSSLNLHSELPDGLCIDGEISFFTSLSVKIENEALRFIVPNGCNPLPGFIRPL